MSTGDPSSRSRSSIPPSSTRGGSGIEETKTNEVRNGLSAAPAMLPVHQVMSPSFGTIVKLQGDGSNYHSWAYHLTLLLKSYGIYEAVIRAEALDATGYVRNNQALTLIARTLSDDALSRILHLEDATLVWTELKNCFSQQGIEWAIRLRRELMALDYNEGDYSHIRDWLNALRDLRRRIASASPQHAISDADYIVVILGLLPDKYTVLRTVLSTSNEITLVRVETALCEEFDRFSKTTTKSSFGLSMCRFLGK